ncbi:actin filament debranching protein [Malassezia pachydermatis]
MSTTVDIDPSLLTELRTFRLSKSTSKGAAFVVKIDKKKLLIEKEEILDPITPEELEEELPEHSPRFVILSFELHHADGRTSYPLVLIHWAPVSASMELSTLYASALSMFSVKADVGKVIDIRDGSLTTAMLTERLGGARR